MKNRVDNYELHLCEIILNLGQWFRRRLKGGGGGGGGGGEKIKGGMIRNISVNLLNFGQ